MTVIKRRSYDIMVGTFVAISLLVLVAVVFLIGRERKLFDTRVSVEAHFPNVAGLAIGADVMLSGVVVGHVSTIRFPSLDKDMPGLSRDVTVVMEISKGYMPWVREDSIARIDSKGLLGDKLINISIGSPELPEMQPSGMLQSTAPLDFNKALQQAQEILENVTETIASAKDIFKGFAAHGGDEALASSAKSLRHMLAEIEKGDGIIHQLIYDKQAGSDTKSSVKSLKTLLASIDRTAGDVEKLTHEIKTGNGLLHALVYDKEGANTIAKLDKSLDDISHIFTEIKTGSGIVHDLVYAQDKGQFLRSLNNAAADIESMTADVRSGKGSLGLLLKDPSLYNSLNRIVNDLGRSSLLRMFIRRGLSNDERPKN